MTVRKEVRIGDVGNRTVVDQPVSGESGALRKVAGWTTQQLANELGVARQTISNLETGRSPMTKLQYLALRTVFSAEIAKCGNRELAKIIKTLVDDPIELRIKGLGRPVRPTMLKSRPMRRPTIPKQTALPSLTLPAKQTMHGPSHRHPSRLPADGHAKTRNDR